MTDQQNENPENNTHPSIGCAWFSILITVFATVPVYLAKLTGSPMGNGDMSQSLWLSFVNIVVAPTGLIAALVAIGKRYPKAGWTLGAAVVALLLASFVWGFRLGG